MYFKQFTWVNSAQNVTKFLIGKWPLFLSLFLQPSIGMGREKNIVLDCSYSIQWQQESKSQEKFEKKFEQKLSSYCQNLKRVKDPTLAERAINNEEYAANLLFSLKEEEALFTLEILNLNSGESLTKMNLQGNPSDSSSEVLGFVGEFFKGRKYIGYVDKVVGKRIIVKLSPVARKDKSLLKQIIIYPDLKTADFKKAFDFKKGLEGIDYFFLIEAQEDSAYFEAIKDIPSELKDSLVFFSPQETIEQRVQRSSKWGDFSFVIAFQKSEMKSIVANFKRDVAGHGLAIGLGWKMFVSRGLFLQGQYLKSFASLKNKIYDPEFSGVALDRTDLLGGLGIRFQQKKLSKHLTFELSFNYHSSDNIITEGTEEGFVSYSFNGIIPSFNINYQLTRRANFYLSVSKSLWSQNLVEAISYRSDLEGGYMNLNLGLKLEKDANSFALLSMQHMEEENSQQTFRLKQNLFTMNIIKTF